MPEKKESHRWDDFIKASMELSSLRFGDAEDDRAETGRNRMLAEILFDKPSNLVDASVINGTLLGTSRRSLRRGTGWRLKGKVPDADLLEACLDHWHERALRGLKLYSKSSVKRRECFCWRMHDELRGMDAFREGNGQTGRFVLNHLRVLLGLPILILDEKNAGEYHRRLDMYIVRIYVPSLPRLVEHARAVYERKRKIS